MKTELYELLFGDISPAKLFLSFISFVLGFAIFHFITVEKAVRKNKRTPTRFSGSYWWENNGRGIVRFLLIAFATVAFTPQILMYFNVSEMLSQYSGTPFAFLVLGFGYEKLRKAAKNKFGPKDNNQK